MTQPLDHVAEFAVTETDRQQIIDLLAGAFRTDFGGRSYFIQPPTSRILARGKDGNIVGQLGLFHRHIRLGAQDIRIVGFGDVAVRDNHRGHGVGGTLVQAGLGVAQKVGVPFVLLEGDSGIYDRHGFRPMSNPIRYAVVKDGVGTTVAIAADIPLMVCAMADEPWPENVQLDLFGPRF